MSNITLHSFRRCPFAIRVRMVLEEKGLPFRLIEEDLSHPSSELLAMHPEGRVPLLVHHIGGQDHVVFQSTVITEYLEDAFPVVSLMPKSALARAQVRLWTYWCDYLFKPDLDLYKYELSTLDSQAAQSLLERLHSYFSKWNSALQSHPFLIGNEISLADIHLFPFARQFMAAKPALPGVEQYQDLLNWLEKLTSRPAFERVMAKR